MNSMICPYCGKLIAYNSYFDVFYCSKCGGFFKQATVMECNDLNEPLTLDDAIAHLDDTLSDTGRKWSCESCRMEHVQLRAWLAELREIKQERNTPLTLDELRKMDGEPVWVVYGEDEGMWALVEVCEESIFLTNNLGGRTEYGDDAELEDDGLTVYRQKPEEGTK